MTIRRFTRFLWAILAVTGAANAQTITASITGTASDPSGAVIAGGTVIATNTDTNVATTTTTNAEGIYTFPFLRVGPTPSPWRPPALRKPSSGRSRWKQTRSPASI